MISLDDTRWSKLQHAYGDAGDVPNLIQALELSSAPSAGYEEEPWHGLWSRLCHQGDAYTASYAAVPHIVRIAGEAVGPIHFSFFQLPAAIEVARQTGRGPAVTEVDSDAYHRAIGLLIENASRHRRETWDRAMLLSISAAQAAAKGHIDIAEAILNLDSDWIAKINSGEMD